MNQLEKKLIEKTHGIDQITTPSTEQYNNETPGFRRLPNSNCMIKISSCWGSMFRFLQIFGLLPLGQKSRGFWWKPKRIGAIRICHEKGGEVHIGYGNYRHMTWGIILPSQNEGMEYK